MTSDHLPGVAAVVVQNGKVLHARGYGVASIDGDQPVRVDDTLFRIGSISKALTALAITRLVERGTLDWDGSVDGYAPIQNLSGGPDPVRLRHLVTHTGGFDQIGLDRHVYEFDRPLVERKALRPSLAEFLAAGNLRRTAPPGTFFRYDTYGITLAGHILATATGLKFPQAMQQELFTPLGMTRSFVETDARHFDQLATGYGYVDGQYVAMPYEVYVTTPASSIDATAGDMGRLLVALTADGANASGRLLSGKTVQGIWDGQFRPHPEFHGISHGFWELVSVDRQPRAPLRAFVHGGTMLGFTSSLTIVPELNVGIFVVANRDAEAGGPPVRLGRVIDALVVEALSPRGSNIAPPFTVPKTPPPFEPASYVGDYYFGTYCQSCTPEEFKRGAWPRGPAFTVQAGRGGLDIRGERYLATDERDIFVRDDGERRVLFGRDLTGNVRFFLYENDPETFERDLGTENAAPRP